MRTRQILVIEDDRCLYNSIQRCLKALGHGVSVEWGVSTEDAYERLRAKQFDLIIADYLLCGFETGIDLWKRCQTICPATPFVMISGLPISEFLDQMKDETNCPPFLSKPFRHADLVEMIKEHI